jgi:predicted metal-dependent phosphoesterase TrpH
LLEEFNLMIRYPSVDLHTHTTYSDGADTPSQLVAKAANVGVWHLAVTDHDTDEALPEARQAGLKYGVEIFGGIELTVQYEDYQDIHLLAYGFDADCPALVQRLHTLQAHRVERGLEMLRRINERLSAAGRTLLDRDRVLARADGALARPHLAKELLEQGHVQTFQDAFRDFLIPCNVPKASLGLDEAVALIAQAGGICSLAHPGTLSSDTDEIARLLTAFAAMGMVGVEAYPHCHGTTFSEFLCTCARRLGLVETGGSDYHGRAQGATLGFIAPNTPVPDTVLNAITEVTHAQVRNELKRDDESA